MQKKYLKQLSIEEATMLMYSNDAIGTMIPEDVWLAAKISGPKLFKVAEDNAFTVKNFKKALNLDDNKMKVISEFVKKNYPECEIQKSED